MANLIFHLPFLLILSSLEPTHVIGYTATNRVPGTPRFRNEIGAQYIKQTLVSATQFIWRTFQQNCLANRRNVKNVSQVNLFIDTYNGVAYSINNEIHVNASYIEAWPPTINWHTTCTLFLLISYLHVICCFFYCRKYRTHIFKFWKSEKWTTKIL